LFGISEKVKNFAVIYLVFHPRTIYASFAQVDISKVPDFSKMYELYGKRFLKNCCGSYYFADPCTAMFFFRNKHIMIDLGTGNNNKINVGSFLDVPQTQNILNLSLWRSVPPNCLIS
jgi:DIM1 family U5 snRNP protein